MARLPKAVRLNIRTRAITVINQRFDDRFDTLTPIVLAQMVVVSLNVTCAVLMSFPARYDAHSWWMWLIIGLLSANSFLIVGWRETWMIVALNLLVIWPLIVLAYGLVLVVGSAIGVNIPV